MPPKLKYEIVKKFFTDNDCKLLSKTYESNKQKLEYICKCGHTRISRFYNIKRLNQFTCRACTNKWEIVSENNMHPKKFEKVIRVMNLKYERSLKYRSRFTSEKKIICSLCKKNKKIMYFYPSNLNKNNNSLRCRFCNNNNCKKRRSNHSQDQVINFLLTTCRSNSRKRENNGRNCKFDITKEDIYNLIEIQNNKCAYTNQELIWKYNNPYKASIDRIDSNKGYIITNIQLVSHISNQAKSDLDEKKFFKMIEEIYNTRIKKNNKKIQKSKNILEVKVDEKPKKNLEVKLQENEKKNVKKNKKPKEIYKCTDCDIRISKGSTRCRSCASIKSNETKKKVKDRPSLETLLKDLETMPYTKVGKKYGVSDNCIRKWIKNYKKKIKCV